MITYNSDFQISEKNLKKVLEEFFLILNDTERTVVTKRFALDNKPKQTLEKIGKHFDVTRERIRQIENSALKKLRRHILGSQIINISKIAESILKSEGGVMTKDNLISQILKTIHTETPYSGNVVKFTLALNEEIDISKRSRYFDPFYYDKSLSLMDLQKGVKALQEVLKTTKEVMNEHQLVKQAKTPDIPVNTDTLRGILKISDRFMYTDKKNVGLSKWRSINPKSIRDKSILILEKAKKPLHFIDIANKITSFGKKVVTTQAVHNDLIRYPDFVLVGRGIYALKKWGIPEGTVMDIIAAVLKKKGPLSRQQIIEEVGKYREVKSTTISLNLQKSPAFVRVGRAIYDFDEKAWEEPKKGRGRAFLKD